MKSDVYFESAVTGPQQDLVYAAVKEAIEKEKRLNDRLNETQQPLSSSSSPRTTPANANEDDDDGSEVQRQRERMTNAADRENKDAEPPFLQSTTTETVNKRNTYTSATTARRGGGYDSDIPPLVAQRMLLEHIIGSEDKLVKAATDLVKTRKMNEARHHQQATNLSSLGEDNKQEGTPAHAPLTSNVEDELTRVVEQYATVFHKFMVIGERQVAWHLLGRLERLIALFDGSRIEREHGKHQAELRSSEKVMARGSALPTASPAASAVRSSRVTFVEKKYQEHVSVQSGTSSLVPQPQGGELTSSDPSAAMPPILLPLNLTTMRICKSALGNLFRAYEYAQQKVPAGDGIVSQELVRQRIVVQGANRLAARQGVADPAELTLDPYLTRKMLESEDKHYPTTVAHALERALKNSRPLSASVTRREREEPVAMNVIANLLASESRGNRKQSELDAERSHDLPIHKKQLFYQRKFSPSSLAHSEENPHAYFLRTTSNVSTRDRDRHTSGGGDDGVKKRPFRPSSAHASIGRSCSSHPSPSSSAAVSRSTSFQRSTLKAKTASCGSSSGRSDAAPSANTYTCTNAAPPQLTAASTAQVVSSPSSSTCNKIDSSVDAQRPRYYGKALFGPPKKTKVTGSTAVKRPHSAGVSIGGILKKNSAENSNSNSKVDEAPAHNKNRVGGAEVGIGVGGPKPLSRPTTAGNAKTNPVPRPPSVLVQVQTAQPFMGQRRVSSYATTARASNDDDDTVAVGIVEDEDDHADDEALDAAFAGGGASSFLGAAGIGTYYMTDPRRPTTTPSIKNGIDTRGAGSYGRQNTANEDGGDLRAGGSNSKQEGLCPRPPSASVGGRPDAKKDDLTKIGDETKPTEEQLYDCAEVTRNYLVVAECDDHRSSLMKGPSKTSNGSRPSSAALRNWCDPQLVNVYAPVKEEEAPDEGEESLIRFLRGENEIKTPAAGKEHSEKSTGVAPQHSSDDADEGDMMKNIRERVARASEGLGHELLAATLSTSALSLNPNNYFHPSQKTVREEEAQRRAGTVDQPYVSKRARIIVGKMRQFLARRHVERLRLAAEKRCEVRAYLEEKEYWAGELSNDTADDLLAIAYFEKQADAHTAKIEGINMHFKFQRKLTKIIARIGASFTKKASAEESDSEDSSSSSSQRSLNHSIVGDVGGGGVGLYARRPSTQINVGHINHQGTRQGDEEASSSPHSSLSVRHAAPSEPLPAPPSHAEKVQLEEAAEEGGDRIRGMNLGYSSYIYPKTPSRDEGEVYRAYVAELQQDAWRLLHSSEYSAGGGGSTTQSESGAEQSKENKIGKGKVELRNSKPRVARVVLVAGVDTRPKQATTSNTTSDSQEMPKRSETASVLPPIHPSAPHPPRPPPPTVDLSMRTADPSVESTSRRGLASQLPTSATSTDRPHRQTSKKKINKDDGGTSSPSSFVSYERQNEPYDGRYSSSPNTKAFEEEMMLASEAMADLRRAMGRVL